MSGRCWRIDLLWVLCMLGQCWWIDLLALCMSGQRWWTDLLALCMSGQCWWIDLLALCMSGQRWRSDLNTQDLPTAAVLRELCMTEESYRVRFCCLWLCPLVFVWRQARAVNLPFCVGFVDGKAEEGRKKERKTERRRE